LRCVVQGGSQDLGVTRFDRARAEIEFVAGGLSRNTRCKYRKKQDGKERIANSKSVQALHA